MKKFAIQIALFSLVPVCVLTAMFVIPVNRKYAYDFVIRGGCEGRSSWIYQRMCESDSIIDVAFIGSSHTMSAVDDELIERYFNDSTHQSYKFVNLGYCGFGRDFHYLIAKDLLEHKKVKGIVLELNEEESQFGNPCFPNVASSADLIRAPLAFNRNYFPDLYKGLVLRIQYFRELVTKENVQRELPVSDSRFGFNGTDRLANRDELENAKQKNYGPHKKSFGFIENGLNSIGLEYVRRIAEMAEKNNAKLYFIYLPEFGFPLKTNELEETYGRFGKIIYPRQSFLDTPANWCDKGHLNTQAAINYAKPLSDQLINTLK